MANRASLVGLPDGSSGAGYLKGEIAPAWTLEAAYKIPVLWMFCFDKDDLVWIEDESGKWPAFCASSQKVNKTLDGREKAFIDNFKESEKLWKAWRKHVAKPDTVLFLNWVEVWSMLDEKSSNANFLASMDQLGRGEFNAGVGIFELCALKRDGEMLKPDGIVEGSPIGYEIAGFPVDCKVGWKGISEEERKERDAYLAWQRTTAAKLHQAMWDGDVQRFDKLIGQEFDFEDRPFQSKNGFQAAVANRSLLGSASCHSGGKAYFVERLLKRGCDPNTRCKGEASVLMAACTYPGPETPQIMELLLTTGADPNFRDKNRETALHAACRKGREDCVRILLAHGADPSVRCVYKWSPFDSVRSRAGCEKICSLLIEACLKMGAENPSNAPLPPWLQTKAS